MTPKTSNECQWYQYEHLQFWLFDSFCTNGFFFFDFIWLSHKDILYKHWLINPSEFKLNISLYRKQRISTMAIPGITMVIQFVKLIYFTSQIAGLSAHVSLFSLIFEKGVPPSSSYSLNVCKTRSISKDILPEVRKKRFQKFPVYLSKLYKS